MTISSLAHSGVQITTLLAHTQSFRLTSAPPRNAYTIVSPICTSRFLSKPITFSNKTLLEYLYFMTIGEFIFVIIEIVLWCFSNFT